MLGVYYFRYYRSNVHDAKRVPVCRCNVHNNDQRLQSYSASMHSIYNASRTIL